MNWCSEPSRIWRWEMLTETETCPAVTVLAPFAHLGQCLAEHPAPDRHHQAGLLQHADELVRTHQPALRMAPAQQGLEAGDAACGHRVARLVHQQELVAFDASRMRRSRSRRSRIACIRACEWKRKVLRPADLASYIAESAALIRCRASRAVVGPDADADAGGQRHRPAAQHERLAEGRDQELRVPDQPSGVRADAGRWRTRRCPAAPADRPCDRQASSRSATACSNSSPASWPSISLTCLRRSRSISSHAKSGHRRGLDRLQHRIERAA
jgi:hypothetical protein